MGLPLDKRGLLPPGRHDYRDWAEIEAQFAFNEWRSRMLERALLCVAEKLQFVAAGLDIVVGGSFLSDKDHPSDIDLAILLPSTDIGAYGPLMQLFIEDKFAIKKNYSVDMNLTLLHSTCKDTAAYFEYVGEKTGEAKSLSPRDKRGTIRVKSWIPG